MSAARPDLSRLAATPEILLELAGQGPSARRVNYRSETWDGTTPQCVQRALETCEAARRRFDREDHGLKDETPSGVDLSLAALLHRRGVSGADIENGIRASRALAGLEEKPYSYYRATVGRALASTPTASSVASEHGAELDLANADVFVELYRDRVRYVAEAKSWYASDKVRLKPDKVCQVRELAKAVPREVARRAAEGRRSDEEFGRLMGRAKRAATARGVRDLLFLAESALSVEMESLDSEPLLLGCQNGLLDLQTFELRPPDPVGSLVTRTTAAPYDPEARSDLFESFVERIIPDVRVRRFVQRAAGVSCTGLQLKSFFFAYGPPDSGKSTFLEALVHALGGYATTTSEKGFTTRRFENHNTPELAKLPGFRLATVSELKRGQSFDPAVIKRWTGGDRFQAMAKHCAPFEFVPQATLWFAANERPAIPHDDLGMWNRVFLIPFEQTIPRREQDPELLATLQRPEHAAAILAWAVRGWRDVVDAGKKLCPPKAVRIATADYRTENDPLGGFLKERCRLRKSAWTPFGDIYGAYTSWAAGAGVEAMPVGTFGKELTSRGFKEERRKRDKRQLRGRLGIALRGDG